MKILILLIVLLNIYLLGCNNEKKKDPAVNENSATQKITDDQKESDREIAFIVNGKPYYKKDIVNVQSALQDAIIYEAAILEGKDKDPQYLKKVEIFQRNLLLGQYKGEIIKNHLSTRDINDEDIQKFYEKHLPRFSTLNLTKLSTNDKEISDNIYKELQDGKSIDGIKSTYSDIFTVELDSRRYNKHFKDFKPSEFTIPISENNFYNIYIINSVETEPVRVVRRMVKSELLNQEKQIALKQFADNIKKEKNIKVEMVNQ